MPAQTSPPPGAARSLPPRLSAGVALLLAAIAGALLMAAGTARITQLRRAIHRTRRGQPPAPATPGR
jgi:hypothetical protein